MELLKTVTPLVQTTTYTYDAYGNQSAVTSSLGYTTQSGYDDLRRLKTVTDTSGDGMTLATDPRDAANYIAGSDSLHDRITS